MLSFLKGLDGILSVLLGAAIFFSGAFIGYKTGEWVQWWRGRDGIVKRIIERDRLFPNLFPDRDKKRPSGDVAPQGDSQPMGSSEPYDIETQILIKSLLEDVAPK